MIIPIAAPRNWFAPKRLAAEIPTKIGKNMNGAADISWIIEEIPSIAGYISSIDFGPKSPAAVKKFCNAINKPPATRAGIIGTKISDNNLINAIMGLNFLSLLAICFKSSVEISESPVFLISSS